MTEQKNYWDEAESSAEAIFIACDALASLHAPLPESEVKPHFCFNDLYAYATDPDLPPKQGLVQTISTNPKLRNDMRLLLERVAPMRPISRAAASSGSTTTRFGTGFQMTLRESHADRDQLYVIITLHDQACVPNTLFVINDTEGCNRVPLPEPSDGTVQLLLGATSTLAVALRDPKTDVFMR
ncbi:MAG: hypothetical protein CMM52_14100 [Rhodospirillaceae bacterium]|nr:hypothetical protein [Rhodospirillaceae bacterium]|tara:strand:+ start:38216 stop:38764 length:549 start_codon:yes stop_codon:yes gene_type:complete